MFLIGSIIFVFSLAVSVAFSALSPETLATAPATSLETCKTLIDNGEGNINILFFADERKAKKYSNFLFSTPPLDQQKEKFNVYYIDSYEPECELYQKVALLCTKKETKKMAASCPDIDFIYTLKPASREIRSSTYMNFVSINTKHPLSVITHETGHALANLADEYLLSGRIPRGAKNCQPKCDGFEGKNLDGCYKGCTKDTYQRSIDNGVMRTLSSNEYGAFNENLILEEISKLINNKPKPAITGLVTANSEEPSCEKQNYFLIEIGHNPDGTLFIVDKTIETGCLGGNGVGGSTLNLIRDEETVHTENFNDEIIFSDDGTLDESLTGETFLSDKNFFLSIPADTNANKLRIENQQGETILTTDLNMGTRPCKN